jgi:hypothetical protein
MHYRSLLFSGVFITAITSLLIVQSCTKYNQAGTESDLELVAAITKAQSYLQGLSATGSTIMKRGYFTTQEKLDRDQYVQNKSIIKNWCVSKNNQDACSTLSSLKGSEINLENIFQMQNLIGK